MRRGRLWDILNLDAGGERPSAPRGGSLIIELEGRRFGSYRLGPRIGRGGMAVVYRGSHLELGREDAVKILLPDQPEANELLARFKRESRILAGLSHPGITRIYDYGQCDGLFYCAMNLIRDPTLQKVLEEELEAGRPMPEPRAVTLLISLLEILDVVHQVGVIHRDVKPSNIFVTDRDTVILSDFGIAKPGDARTQITRSNSILGSLHYMAPEQLDGKEVDVRADIYAAGMVLYELVCGRLPFKPELEDVLRYKVLQPSIPRPRDVDAGVSPDLDRVIMKACARSPEDRFGSAMEFRAALLEPGLSPRPSRAGEAPSRRSSLDHTLTRPPDVSLNGKRSSSSWPGIALALVLGVVLGRGVQPRNPSGSTQLPITAAPGSPGAGASGSGPGPSGVPGSVTVRVPAPVESARQSRPGTDHRTLGDRLLLLWPDYRFSEVERRVLAFREAALTSLPRVDVMSLIEGTGAGSRDEQALGILREMGRSVRPGTIEELARLGFIHPATVPMFGRPPSGPVPPAATGGASADPGDFLGIDTMVRALRPARVLDLWLGSLENALRLMGRGRAYPDSSVRISEGVTSTDLKWLVGYFYLVQPGFPERAGPSVARVLDAQFDLTDRGASLDLSTSDEVGRRARLLDLILTVQFAPPTAASRSQSK